MAKAPLQGRGSRFAEMLRREMAAHEMSQQALADHLGCTQAAVSYWTRGKREPSLERLSAMADLFLVSTDYMLGREP